MCPLTDTENDYAFMNNISVRTVSEMGCENYMCLHIVYPFRSQMVVKLQPSKPLQCC